jgi:hypothetical protein
MKAVCHLMSPYKRDGQYPEVKETIVIQSLIAHIGEYVQVGEKEYNIQTVQNVLTKEDGQVRVYVMWEADDYRLYIEDARRMQMQQKSNLVTL